MKPLWPLLLICGIVLSACSAERRVAKRLDGSWIINSYVVTPDSSQTEVEMLGLLFSRGIIEFEAYDLSNSIGEFTINLTDIISDSLVVTEGSYALTENGEELILTIGNVDNNTLVDVNKETLVIDGIIDNISAKINADRL